jgi:8-oxo-dGTP pyrophosphatase MutT (NUDIX family)
VINEDIGGLVFKGEVFSIFQREVDEAPGVRSIHELATCNDAVRIYPVDDQDRLHLIREYRYELDEEIMRCVSGSLDDNEDAGSAAARELREELGLDAVLLDVFHVSEPMLKVRHKVFHFLAQGLSRTDPAPEPGERIEPVVVPMSQVRDLVEADGIREDIVAFALLKLALTFELKNV